ncbi:heavy metal translocating P-type ATPase [Methylobrevis albus]|uniref:P-type Zn(2+) transporter n=1 Tax=Methylobrevis albus TaxID=2793297 RepID=A0A931I0M8_9HYPH|nr:heavy metal translocating P-type ATPase [Methylobrevis albus]MBH0237990.1 cadmium-translocating P-type ATPase [Methylobrevis albus]
MPAETLETRFHVDGMDCAACARKIETATRRLPGVEDVTVSVTAAAMTLTHTGGADLDKVAATLARLGYPARPAAPRATPGTVAGPAPDDGCGCGHAHEHAHDDPHEHGHAHGHDHGTSHEHEHEPEHHRDGDSHESPTQPAPAGAALGHLHAHAPDDGPWWRTRKAALTLASGGALGFAYAFAQAVPSLGFEAFLVAMAVGLVPIARRAVVAASLGSPFTIETLMTLAAIGAVAIGATEEASVVVVLFLVGEMLEGVAAARARASIRGLADLVPKTARLERDGKIVEVPAADLAVGALVQVRPGDRMPADGEIVAGESAVDEAPVTGESVPKPKAPGDAVFAGTVNGEGVLRIRVTAAAADNTIARVVRLVEEAQESKAPTERFIDRFSRYYTPAVLVVATLVAVLPPLLAGADWQPWIYKGLAILLIGCPCALVISVPAAIAAGLAAGARRGLLMKGGVVLERLGGLTVIALDKTGTLTEGRPRVTDVAGFGGAAADEVVALAAALEAGSSHPLARAILDEAARRAVAVPPATAARAVPGKGVAGVVAGVPVFLGSAAAVAADPGLGDAEAAAVAASAAAGHSVAVLVRDGRPFGFLALRDELKPDARRGIAALKAAGLRPLMLTGDNRRTAAAVAAELGIEVKAELLPADKQRIVRDLQAGGARVGKVGDGINDAPALAAADIGIAIGGGSDVALETADAAVLHGRVTDIADMVALSRATMANIRVNIAVALGLKAVFLVTTLAGVTGLWPAILADTGATVLVTANAMRLLRWKGGA